MSNRVQYVGSGMLQKILKMVLLYQITDIVNCYLFPYRRRPAIYEPLYQCYMLLS